MQKQFGVLCLLFVINIVLAAGAAPVFAQCGPDGTQPCTKSTASASKKKVVAKPKAITKQTPPVTKPKTISKANPASSPVRNSLLAKLLGEWAGEEGDMWIFLPNGTGTYSVSNEAEPCQTFKFVLSGNILKLTSKSKCADEDPDTETYQINFNEEGLFSAIAPNEDGSYEEPAFLWHKSPPDMSDIPFKKRILGKWTDGEKNYWIFMANGTGSYLDKDTICQRFKYTLDEVALKIIPKSTGKCEVGEDDFNVEENYTIEFNDENQLGATSVNADGTTADSATWWTRIS